MPPLVVRLEHGDVELREWPAWAARILDEMAALAAPGWAPDGPVRERLFPLATDDPDHAEEWRRNVHPELYALFASSHEIVKKDLAAAERDEDGELVRLRIPHAHVPGWIAALNTARLHLGAAHDVDAKAMQAPLEELDGDLRAVVARIDLLAELQYHLIRGEETAPAATETPKAGRAAKPGKSAKSAKPLPPAKPPKSGPRSGPAKPKKPKKPRDDGRKP